MTNAILEMPVFMYVYSYRPQSHKIINQDVSLPCGNGSPRCHYTAILVKHCASYMKLTVVSRPIVHGDLFIWQRTQLYHAACMKDIVLSWSFPHGLAYIQQRKLWFLCTLGFLLYRQCSCRRTLAVTRALTLLLLLEGDIESNPEPSKQWLKKQPDKQQYLLQREKILSRKRLQYAENPAAEERNFQS